MNSKTFNECNDNDVFCCCGCCCNCSMPRRLTGADCHQKLTMKMEKNISKNSRFYANQP